MNKKRLIQFRRKIYSKYKIPGMSNLHRVKQNCVFIHTSNGIKHEQKKLEICYELQKNGMKYITESQSCKDGRIIDVICLDTGTEVEIVDSSLTKKTKEAIAKGDIPILVIKLDDSFSLDDLLRRELE
ncbi:MAG: hypothetical protein DRN81_02150 [Thermoproteota archaeon]|nr:MAG: hypothetical protein DRN81_02150 [Candidatus Korarchaeota archaeon]